MQNNLLCTLLLITFLLLVVCQVVDSGRNRKKRKKFIIGGRYVVERKSFSSSLSSSTPSSVSKAMSYSLNPSFLKPTYMRYINSKTHTPGTDVVLVCMTSGVKPITYTWFYNGHIIQEHGSRKRLKFNEERSILKIRRIRDADVGVYTCKATNAYGSLSFDFNMKLKGKQKKPLFYDHVIMERKQSAIRPIRQTIRFDCEADGEGVIHYIWLKNGKPFKHIEHSKSSTNDGKFKNNLSGDLVLNNLKINDGGLYTCIAINKYGNASFTYELRIIRKLTGGPPKVILYTRPQTMRVKAGSNVSFDCLEIISATIPDVRWFHLYEEVNNKRVIPKIPEYINWNDINSPEHPFTAKYISAEHYMPFQVRWTHRKPENEYVYDDTDPSGLRLNLVNVTTKDTGAYTCYVSNLEGSDYEVYYLIVEGQSNE